jgi:hypothetical protein
MVLVYSGGRLVPMAVVVQEIESLPAPEREREIRRLIEEKREQIATLEEMLPAGEKRIVVNGREHSVTQKEISYEEIIEIAHGPKARGRVLSVVCHGGGTDCTVTPGKSVRIENDMVFSAYDTSNA